MDQYSPTLAAEHAKLRGLTERNRVLRIENAGWLPTWELSHTNYRGEVLKKTFPMLQAISVEGTEQISELYEYKVQMITPNYNFGGQDILELAFEKWVGNTLKIGIETQDHSIQYASITQQIDTITHFDLRDSLEKERNIQGIITDSRFIRTQKGTQGHIRAIYEVTIKPELIKLQHRTNFRTFYSL